MGAIIMIYKLVFLIVFALFVGGFLLATGRSKSKFWDNLFEMSGVVLFIMLFIGGIFGVLTGII